MVLQFVSRVTVKVTMRRLQQIRNKLIRMCSRRRVGLKKCHTINDEPRSHRMHFDLFRGFQFS